MAWTIEYSPLAKKQLAKFDRTISRRIDDFLQLRVATQTDPRLIGKALRGPLNHRWRYRLGDYRIVCDIQDAKVLILVVELGHRGDIYR